MKLIIGDAHVTCMNDTMKYIRKHYPNTYLTIEKLYVLHSEITYGFKRFREMYYLFSVRFQGKPFNIMVMMPMPQPVMLKKLKLIGSMKTYKTF